MLFAAGNRGAPRWRFFFGLMDSIFEFFVQMLLPKPLCCSWTYDKSLRVFGHVGHRGLGTGNMLVWLVRIKRYIALGGLLWSGLGGFAERIGVESFRYCKVDKIVIVVIRNQMGRIFGLVKILAGNLLLIFMEGGGEILGDTRHLISIFDLGHFSFFMLINNIKV